MNAVPTPVRMGRHVGTAWAATRAPAWLAMRVYTVRQVKYHLN